MGGDLSRVALILRPRPEEFNRLFLPDAQFEASALAGVLKGLAHPADWLLALLCQLLHASVDLARRDDQAFDLGNGLEQQCPSDLGLGARAHLAPEGLEVEVERAWVYPAAGQRAKRPLEHGLHAPLDHGLGDGEGI